ncbi:MAG: hypothetical protein AAF598_16000 [Bacteroidota bacterium]
MKKLIGQVLALSLVVLLISSCSRGFGKSDPCNYGFDNQPLEQPTFVFVDEHC